METEMKIGQTLPFGLKYIQCVTAGNEDCMNCCLFNTRFCQSANEVCGKCYHKFRSDNTDVIFKLVDNYTTKDEVAGSKSQI